MQNNRYDQSGVTVQLPTKVVKNMRQIDALYQFVCNICYNSHRKCINSCQIMMGVNCNSLVNLLIKLLKIVCSISKKCGMIVQEYSKKL